MPRKYSATPRKNRLDTLIQRYGSSSSGKPSSDTGSETIIEGAVPEKLSAEARNKGRPYTDFSVFEFVEDQDNQEDEGLSSQNEGTSAATRNGENKPAAGTKDSVPDESPIEKFHKYMLYSRQNYRKFPPELRASVELMKMVNDKGGSHALYNEIYEWHMKHSNGGMHIKPKELYDRLLKRYNMEGTMPFEIRVELPHSKAKVGVVCHDCLSQTVDLLTDTRLEKKHFLFHGNDPFAGPPDEFKTIADINTGLCYRKTYEELIEPEPITKCGRQKVLLPFIFYLDGCVTGQFDNLSLEILKFTLGIFNSECRNKDWAWRNLGYVAHFLKQKNQAEEMIKKSSHVDSQNYVVDTEPLDDEMPDPDAIDPEFNATIYMDEDEDADRDDLEPKIPEIAAQDLHKMLQVMLAPYKTMQDRGGFNWDQPHEETVYHLRYIPFVMLIKGDGAEHDKHCGQYGSRTQHVKCLCRYCTIPTRMMDMPYHDSPRKTVDLIKGLITKKDKEGLRNISQHPIWNAWYEIEFGRHNDFGIHGACPIELLHWIELGWYKYTRANLFYQLGPTSILGAKINACCMHLGYLFKHQSDRNLPRTTFSKGVKKGKLMGHEMSGMMLVLLVTLRCTKGGNMIREGARGKQKNFFFDDRYIRDWIMLLETQLSFEAWMEKPEMEVNDIERAKLKMREVMGMTKQIGKRKEGMGFKTMNYHAAQHVPDDMLAFGVPSNVNTKSNEMHHKRDKKTAKRTQKRPTSFNLQTAVKIQERTLIDLAYQELQGRVRWDYYIGFEEYEKEERLIKKPDKYNLTGTKAEFFKKPGTETWVYRVDSGMKNKHKFRFSPRTAKSIKQVAEFMSDFMESIWVYTECWVYEDENDPTDKQIYHASPYYQGHPWLDWALFDLSNKHKPNRYGIAAQIQCFIDLTDLPENNGWGYEPGFYCIVEPATISADENEKYAQLMELFYKEEDPEAPGTSANLQELCRVDDILEPACLVPDLDNENDRAYLRIRPRTEWADCFEDWLRLEHTRDFDQPQAAPPIPKRRKRKKNNGNSTNSNTNKKSKPKKQQKKRKK